MEPIKAIFLVFFLIILAMIVYGLVLSFRGKKVLAELRKIVEEKKQQPVPAPKEQLEADLEAELKRWWDERYDIVDRKYKFDSTSGHYIDNEGIIDLARHFAEWQRGRLVKNSLCGSVAFCGVSAWVELDSKELTEFLCSHFKDGDEVRVFIIKKEDEICQ